MLDKLLRALDDKKGIYMIDSLNNHMKIQDMLLIIKNINAF